MRRDVHALAFRQAGYFSAAQAREIGYSYQAQKYHVDHGNWLRIDRGLFRLPGWPSRADDVYARWVLWSGGRGVVSHDSALSIHGLSDLNPARVHLTVPPGFRAVDDAVVLHKGTVVESDVENRDSWSVTTVERTLADAAAGDLSQETVTAAVGDAITNGMVTRRRILRRAANEPDRAALRLERALAVVADA